MGVGEGAGAVKNLAGCAVCCSTIGVLLFKDQRLVQLIWPDCPPIRTSSTRRKLRLLLLSIVGSTILQLPEFEELEFSPGGLRHFVVEVEPPRAVVVAELFTRQFL